jgi:Tfp pilus assembly protein PilZ
VAGKANDRRFERHRARIACRIKVGTEEQRGFVTDISAGGLFLETRRALDADTKLVLTLDLSDDSAPLVLMGHVARARRSHRSVASVVSPGIAVELESAPEAYFQLVLDLEREN